MADALPFTVDGIPQLQRALRGLAGDIEDLDDAFTRIADLAARTASSAAPRRTGRLAGTVRGIASKNKATVTAGSATVGYAGPINYGWPRRNIRATHFMQRADPVINARAVGLLEADIDTAIRRRGLT